MGVSSWYLKLQDFNYTLHHIPRTSNSKADILSRLPWYKEQTPQKTAITMLPEKRFNNKIGSKIVLFQEQQFFERGALPVNSIKSTNIQSNIRDKIQKDHRREALVTKLHKEKPTLFREEDKLLYYKDRVYIPPNKKLREQLLNDDHDVPIAGHPGVFKTYKLSNHHYWWPSQLKDVKHMLKDVPPASRTKHRDRRKPLHLTPTCRQSRHGNPYR